MFFISSFFQHPPPVPGRDIHQTWAPDGVEGGAEDAVRCQEDQEDGHGAGVGCVQDAIRNTGGRGKKKQRVLLSFLQVPNIF